MDRLIDMFASLISILAISRKYRRAVRMSIRSHWRGRKAYKLAKVGKGCLFRGFANVNKNTVIGDYVFIGGLNISGMGAVEIGNHTQIAPECLILTSNHAYKEASKLPFDERSEVKPVKIGRCSWIGQRVTLLPGTELGEGVIVQAGAVVCGKIPPLSIIGGVPAKVFAQRDAEHFHRLVSAGEFLTELY